MKCNHQMMLSAGKVSEIDGQFGLRPGHVVLGASARCDGCGGQFTAQAEIPKQPFIGMTQDDVEKWALAYMGALIIWFVKTQGGLDPLPPWEPSHA